VSEAIYVLDSSTVLASLFNERGADAFDPGLEAGLIGTVNLAEIVTKLQERGVGDQDIADTLEDLDLTVEPFNEEQAILAGKLRASTRAKGLSLGDRACLALAIGKGATAVTTDRAWTDLDLPVPVLLIR
jgi:ribonuclease VapC